MNRALLFIRTTISNLWHFLRRTIIDRWLAFLRRIFRFPWRLLTNIPLLLYFIIVICIIGALGTIIPLVQFCFGSSTLTAISVHRSLATYVIAIAVTAFADCLVRQRDEDDVPFKLFLLGLTLVVAGCAITVLLIELPNWVTRLSYSGALMGAWIWLMVNDSHPDLTSGSAYSTIGGEIRQQQ